MCVLIDTNILFSALLFPGSRPALALLRAIQNHRVVLCEQNISEFRHILAKKAPMYLQAGEVFLQEFPYELIPPGEGVKGMIRDVKDQPILIAAMRADVDIIITGDKDFLCLDLKRPRCMTAVQFLQMEGY